MRRKKRQYECKCLACDNVIPIQFQEEPYPEYGETFQAYCKMCKSTTLHTRTLNKKTLAEIHRRQAEQELRQSIIDACKSHGFACRFLYQSVVITTNLADWCFDYHKSKITLYHESTVKINFETGVYAKAHKQFVERKMFLISSTALSTVPVIFFLFLQFTMFGSLLFI